VTLSPAAGVIEAGRHRLRIDYSGPIGKHSQGLFQVPYKVRERGRLVDKRMLATHFEPVHARKMFPSWDEPAFRATFDHRGRDRRGADRGLQHAGDARNLAAAWQEGSACSPARSRCRRTSSRWSSASWIHFRTKSTGSSSGSTP
jgi:hypothetical protein